MKKTTVIFRKFKSSGDIVALFPCVPYDRAGDFCMSYQHTGQHGAASPNLGRVTVPASEGEGRELLRELVRVGYRGLVVKRRVSFAMDRERREVAGVVV
jgi:hypothetical protein